VLQYFDYTIINEMLYYAGEYSTDITSYSQGNLCGTMIHSGVDGAYPFEPLGQSIVFIGSKLETGDEPYIYTNITSVFPCNAPALAESHRQAETNMQSGRGLTSYPNPFTSKFTLHINSDEGDISAVEIFSNTGSVVDKFTGIEANTDYPNVGQTWGPGIYTIKIINRSGVTTQRIVKM
jgi:hypothetical protein